MFTNRTVKSVVTVMIALMFLTLNVGQAAAEGDWLVKQKQPSSKGQHFLKVDGSVEVRPVPVTPPSLLVAEQAKDAEDALEAVGHEKEKSRNVQVKDKKKDKDNLRLSKREPSKNERSLRNRGGDSAKAIGNRGRTQLEWKRPANELDPNYKRPTGTWTRPAYELDPNYKRPAPASSSKLDRGNRPRMLDPYGKSKDDRKEVTGNRGRTQLEWKRPANELDPNYKRPTGTWTRPAYELDPNYKRPAPASSSKLDRGNRPRMLGPYGKSKDTRKEIDGNRGRVVQDSANGKQKMPGVDAQ